MNENKWLSCGFTLFGCMMIGLLIALCLVMYLMQGQA